MENISERAFFYRTNERKEMFFIISLILNLYPLTVNSDPLCKVQNAYFFVCNICQSAILGDLQPFLAKKALMYNREKILPSSPKCLNNSFSICWWEQDYFYCLFLPLFAIGDMLLQPVQK
jgi:hypothetical protein